MSRTLSILLPVNAESIGDMLGVVAIGLATAGALWLPALLGL